MAAGRGHDDTAGVLVCVGSEDGVAECSNHNHALLRHGSWRTASQLPSWRRRRWRTTIAAHGGRGIAIYIDVLLFQTRCEQNVRVSARRRQLHFHVSESHAVKVGFSEQASRVPFGGFGNAASIHTLASSFDLPALFHQHPPHARLTAPAHTLLPRRFFPLATPPLRLRVCVHAIFGIRSIPTPPSDVLPCITRQSRPPRTVTPGHRHPLVDSLSPPSPHQLQLHDTCMPGGN